MHQGAEIQIILHTAAEAVPLCISRMGSVCSLCTHLDSSSDDILTYGAFSLTRCGIASEAHIYSIL
jgi:hypothetical protein